MDSGSAGSVQVRVLEAAADVFRRVGYAAASMEEVRQIAGVSNGSLYHHFPTKAQLADALYADTLVSFHAALDKALEKAADAESGVKGLIGAYITWVVSNPDAARLLERLRLREVAGGSRIAEANARGFARLEQWLQQQAEGGKIQRQTLAVWMALMFAPAMALTPRWTAAAKPTVPAGLRQALAQAAWLAVAAAEPVAQPRSRSHRRKAS